MASKLCRMLAVTALNSASQLPQSRSIADLVRKVVVKGPGVSRIFSRSIAGFRSI
jgi:hypothetical protein